MFEFHKNKILLTISVLVFVINACGAAPQSGDAISTAVAQTVQAQSSLTKIAGAPTLTPEPSVEITATPNSNATNTSTPVVGAPECTTSAKLAAENPPDDTLLKPGENFWKTWTLENTGTCTWDKNYNFVYHSGDLMGGLTSYPLPESIAPGETKDITIYLKAPETDGTFKGYWYIQTPWNTYFGGGFTSDPFYVQVGVSSAKKPQYGITSVTYTLKRDPETGCPTNVVYTAYATITTDGPFELAYIWNQKDGNHSGVKHLTFTKAGSQTISREWMIGRVNNPNPRWMQIIVTGPIYQEYDKVSFVHDCQ